MDLSNEKGLDLFIGEVAGKLPQSTSGTRIQHRPLAGRLVD